MTRIHEHVRVVAISNDAFERLIESAGGLPGVGAFVGRQMSVPDLELAYVRPDGVQKKLFFDSLSFEPEKCLCKAKPWPGFVLTL